MDEYKIMTNTTMQSITTTNTMAVLEGQYNIPMSITISSVNCAGSSTEVIEKVYVGIYHLIHVCNTVSLPQLAALLPVHLSAAVLVSSPVPE